MKTRLVSTLTAIFLLAFHMVNPAKGETAYTETNTIALDTLYGNFTYSNNGTAITIKSYTGPGGAVTIPETITGLPVTTIKDWAFQGCAGLTSVSIPSSVTNIGEGAFSSCAGLTAIIVDSDNPNYSSMAGVLFNKTKTTIFQFPGGLSSYIIPFCVINIGDMAFMDCPKLTSVIIPSSVTRIGMGSFYNCTGLTSVTISSGVTSVEGWAFGNCTGLKSVTIPSSVTSIGDGAFGGCSGLTSLTIPNSVTSIGGWQFEHCTGLTSLTLPSGITSIGPYTFHGCTGLTNVTIPAGVTSIGYWAFKDCSRLTKATFLGNAPAIFVDGSGAGSDIFNGSASGFTVYYYNGKTGFTTPTWYGYPTVNKGEPEQFYGNFTYIDNGTTITIIGFASAVAKSIDIPASIGGKPVTSLAENAFFGCASLQTVTIPASITSIGSNAFSGCGSLTRVIFVGNAPNTVGASAFAVAAPTFKVIYNGTASGFSSPTWQGYPSQALVPSSDVFANVELNCRDREGFMDIVFDHLPTTLNTSPGVGDVRALYSLDGGTSWRPLRTATGDLGSQVPAGLGLKVSWNYDADGILTDPDYGSQIAIQLISTTPPGIREASTPAPNRVPIKPVQVNFCFGDPVNFSLVSTQFGGHTSPVNAPASSAFDNEEQQRKIKSETEAIFQRAGVSTDSMKFVIGSPQNPPQGKRAINVFFTPEILDSVFGVCLPINSSGNAIQDLNRFGKRYSQAVVVIATNPNGLTSAQLEAYQLPSNLAEIIAHEVGHGLGMPHIILQHDSWNCVMDYNPVYRSVSPVLANFSEFPLPMKQEGEIGGGNHNETYYLRRWVEGRSDNGSLTPGEWDLEDGIIPRPLDWRNVVVDLLAVLVSPPMLYDIKILAMDEEDEIGIVVGEWSSLNPQHAIASRIELNGRIQIIASSSPGGAPDVTIVPQTQPAAGSFTPVQGQELKVLKYDALGAVTTIASGTTTSLTASPIMPKDIRVRPSGFDGAHVLVEFGCEPGYRYTLERSDDCTYWEPVPALTNIPGSNEGRMSLLDENAGQEKKALFYRVKAMMPQVP